MTLLFVISIFWLIIAVIANTAIYLSRREKEGDGVLIVPILLIFCLIFFTCMVSKVKYTAGAADYANGKIILIEETTSRDEFERYSVQKANPQDTPTVKVHSVK